MDKVLTIRLAWLPVIAVPIFLMGTECAYVWPPHPILDPPDMFFGMILMLVASLLVFSKER